MRTLTATARPAPAPKENADDAHFAPKRISLSKAETIAARYSSETTITTTIRITRVTAVRRRVASFTPIPTAPLQKRSTFPGNTAQVCKIKISDVEFANAVWVAGSALLQNLHQTNTAPRDLPAPLYWVIYGVSYHGDRDEARLY
ncbi:hypothetical protein K0M31_002266 [Melipona bicolor]|uniref:Uncharacterized protein n=1 Tax=Melipona bicolor TaxID=60889 RepID=A0AA40GHE4_9HYME|nr:hypothetical protein K0M31_002266 [Melipona bicolor]